MLICGIDEAGRGPLAGPVVAAAVVFEEGFLIKNVKDSKILTEYERECLFHKITDKCIEYKIIEIDHFQIDDINILQATMKAMYSALITLTVKPDIFLIDGNYFRLPDNYHLQINHKTVIEGDLKIFQISCASILAKVTRDNIMRGYHLRYPEYNFHKHKGYATPEHYLKIRSHGVSEIHRKSFMKKYNANYSLFQDEVCV
ncbi:MAG: ribonuclease HII [Ignavibacteria bacterium]